jgi:hypothetical protein
MEKKCTQCQVTKSVTDFNKKSTSRDGYDTHCKLCLRARDFEFRSTLNGFFKKLIQSAKQRIKKKNLKDYNNFEITITKEELLEIFNTQDGLCFYSELKMNHVPFTNYMMSIERINSNLGYIKDNIALCCAEFNSSCQWTHEKIKEMLEILAQNITKNEIDFYEKKFHKQAEPKIIKEIDGIEHAKCNICQLFKDHEKEFRSTNFGKYKKRSGICKTCSNFKKREDKKLPIVHMKRLIYGAQSSTKIRKKANPKQERSNEFDIDFEFLINLFNEQNGLCAYSNLPLKFGYYKETNWITSLERIDSLKGYLKDNIVLVCFEFNTPDFTCQAADPDKVQGSSAWSKEKFKYVYDHLILNNQMSNLKINLTS